jgi:hypothetical protein
MSDISLNLDGLIAFLAAWALGLSPLVAILVSSSYALVKARRKHEPFRQQRLAPHIAGMLVSVLGCAAVVILLLFGDTKFPPRTLARWFDKWLVIWMPAVLTLWPLSVTGWKKLRD